MEVHDISLDPRPTIDVSLVVLYLKVSILTSINLVNMDTMKELDLKTMTSTSIILRMTIKSWVKPLGLLQFISTNIK